MSDHLLSILLRAFLTSRQDQDEALQALPQLGGWVGDRRRKMHQGLIGNRLHLFIADKTLVSNHCSEAARLLDPKHFVTMTLAGQDAQQGYRHQLWERFTSALSAIPSLHPGPFPDSRLLAEGLIFTTYTTLAGDAQLHPQLPEAPAPEGPPYSLFDANFVYDTLFVDEVANVRNPQSGTACAVRRVVERAAVVVGATATPIYSSVLDIVNIGRVLGMREFVERDPDPSKVLRPMKIVTHPSDGLRIVDKRVETRRYKYPPVPAVVHSIASQALKIQGSLLLERRRLKAHRLEQAEETTQASPTITSAALSGWNTAVEPVDASDTQEMEIVEAINSLHKTLADDVVCAIGQLLSNAMIRRAHTSLRHDGQTLTAIRPMDLEIVKVFLDAEELERLNNFVKDVHVFDGKFQVLSRRFLKDPSFITNDYHNHWDPPSSCSKVLADKLCEWRDSQAGKPVEEQEKAIIAVWWTSLIPNLQQYLASRGIPTATLTGQQSAVERKKIVDAFQQDADHPAHPVIVPVAGQPHCLAVYPDTHSRVLIISNVASTGVNLQRANRLHLFDIPWAWSHVFQTFGRINRIGQTRPVSAYGYFHPQTFEKDLMTLIDVKKKSGESFFGPPSQRALDKHAVHGEDSSAHDTDTAFDSEAAAKATLENRRAKELATMSRLLFMTNLDYTRIHLPPPSTRRASSSTALDVKPDVAQDVMRTMKAWSHGHDVCEQLLVSSFSQAAPWQADRIQQALFAKRAHVFLKRHQQHAGPSTSGDASQRDAEIYVLGVVALLKSAAERRFRDDILFSLLDSQGYITVDTLFAFPGVVVLSRLPAHVPASLRRSSPLSDLSLALQEHLGAAYESTISWHRTFVTVTAGLGLATWKDGMAELLAFDSTAEPQLFRNVSAYVDKLHDDQDTAAQDALTSLAEALHNSYGTPPPQVPCRFAPALLLGLFVDGTMRVHSNPTTASQAVLTHVGIEAPPANTTATSSAAAEAGSAASIIFTPRSLGPDSLFSDTVVIGQLVNDDGSSLTLDEARTALLTPRAKGFLDALDGAGGPSPRKHKATTSSHVGEPSPKRPRKDKGKGRAPPPPE